MLGFLLSFFFGTKGAKAEKAQLKYGIIHRPTIDGKPRVPLKPVSGGNLAQPKYGIRRPFKPMPRPPRHNGGIRPPRQYKGVVRPPIRRGKIRQPYYPTPLPEEPISERAKPLIETYLDPEVGKEQRESVASMLIDLGAEGRKAVKVRYGQLKKETVDLRNKYRTDRTKEGRKNVLISLKKLKSLKRLLKRMSPRSEQKTPDGANNSNIKVKPLRGRVVKE